MKRWTPEEDAALRTAILAGQTSCQAVALFPGRARNALLSRASRLGLSFGPVKELPPGATSRMRERERARWRETRSTVGKKGVSSWDDKLFEPYAERKARLAAERRAA